MSEENKKTEENTELNYEITTETPQAIVIYCSDPRFQSAFEKFVEEGLSFKKLTYIPIIISF